MGAEIHERSDDCEDDREEKAVGAAHSTSHPQRLVRRRRVGEDDGGEDVEGFVRSVEEASGHHVPS